MIGCKEYMCYSNLMYALAGRFYHGTTQQSIVISASSCRCPCSCSPLACSSLATAALAASLL